MDWSSLNEALGSLKAAMAIAGYLNTVEKKLGAAELKVKISELSDALLKTQSRIEESANLLKQKQAEINRLNEALAFKGKLVFSRGLYYMADASNQPSGDPYCPGCWDASQRAIHLHNHPTEYNTLECPVCRNKFPNGRKPPKPMIA